MSRLEITVDGDDLKAEAMLKVAASTLKTLKAIERQIAKEQGIKAKVLWRIDIFSGFHQGQIAFRGETPRGDTKAKQLVAATWEEANRRMRETKE